MKKKTPKLTLHRETLRRMDVRAGRAADDGHDAANDSCLDSCYLRSCEGGCTISTEIKTQVEIH